MNRRPNKRAIVDFISMEMEKGDFSRESVLSKCGEKWQIATRTFDRYWKEANEAYNKTREAIKEELRGEVLLAEKERLKKAVLTKYQRMEIASDIARGKPWKVGQSILSPSAGDRLRALDYLAKVDGDYAPVRQKIDYGDLSEEQLDKIIKELNEKSE